MDDLAITVVDRDGVSHGLTLRPGESLMEAIREAGLPVTGECGGVCACATCHVHIDAGHLATLAVRSEEELMMLELEETFDQARSRLACQIQPRPALEGLTATLASPGL